MYPVYPFPSGPLSRGEGKDASCQPGEGKGLRKGEQQITRLTLKNRGAAGRDPQERWTPQEWQRGSRVGTTPVFADLSNVKSRDITVES